MPRSANGPGSPRAESRRCSSLSPSLSRWKALAGLDGRELLASRAWWLLLAMVGPLVGQAFLTAVRTYSEMSGGGNGPAALAQGLSPLDGIVVPTLGAYDLAVTFLFPFVAIRLVAAERESGAARLLVQTPARLPARLAVKAGVLLLGWLAAWIAGGIALLLWRIQGGHLYAPETANVFLGHLLHTFVAAGVAVAAASVCRSSASAAIVTLGFTVGTWALDFVAVGREGLVARLAELTPAAALRTFEHGELRLATVAILILVGLAGFAFAGVWLDPYAKLATRIGRSVALAGIVLGAATVASSWRSGWDLSEDRRSSFSRADEAALRRIHEPVEVTVHLAPEDPKRLDLDRNVLAKLRRVLPSFRVSYASQSRTGLFESDEHYGEIWYEIPGRGRALVRSTIEPVVLGELYKLANIAGMAPPADSDPPYPGYPLAAEPRGANLVFYLAWPLAVGLAFAASRGRWRSS